MTEQEYLVFERNAFQRLIGLNEQLKEKYKLSSYERFDYDQQSGEFVFSDKGVAKVVAKFQIVGSVANEAKTWLWSWANASILETACDQIHRVRDFGYTNSIRKLTERKWTRLKRMVGRWRQCRRPSSTRRELIAAPGKAGRYSWFSRI